MSLDFREETPVGNRPLRVISIKKIFEAMEQCELAWLESIEKEEDRSGGGGAGRQTASISRRTQLLLRSQVK